MTIDWKHINTKDLEEMAVSMSSHSLDRAAERSGEPIAKIRQEIETTINKVEDQLLATSQSVIVKTKDGLNIVGQVLKGKLGPVFRVITVMWKKSFVPNNPNDKVISLDENFIAVDLNGLVGQLEKLSGHRVELKPKNYTIFPCDLINEKKKELLHTFVDSLFDQHALWDSEHSEIYLLSDRNQEPDLPPVTTAYFSPSDGKVVVLIKNRAFADYLRSLAHELIHKAQFHKGNLLTVTSANGLNDEQPLEDEANFLAGRLVRAFGKIYPEIYNEENLV